MPIYDFTCEECDRNLTIPMLLKHSELKSILQGETTHLPKCTGCGNNLTYILSTNTTFCIHGEGVTGSKICTTKP